MFTVETRFDERIREALKVVVSGLDGREEMSMADVADLRRELHTLAGEGSVRFSSAEKTRIIEE